MRRAEHINDWKECNITQREETAGAKAQGKEESDWVKDRKRLCYLGGGRGTHVPKSSIGGSFWLFFLSVALGDFQEKKEMPTLCRQE